MTPDDLRAWIERMDLTLRQAGEHLGVAETTIVRMLNGSVGIDRRTALACSALAMGLQEWDKTKAAELAPGG